MFILLKKDVEKVGMEGQIVKVSDGYATNFLLPKKIGVVVTEADLASHQARQQKAAVAKEVITSKLGMLGEKLKHMKLSLKKRSHDDGKLYGSVSADDIVEILKAKEVKIDRKQVDFEKTIRTTGLHTVIIKLTSKIQTHCSVNVVAE